MVFNIAKKYKYILFVIIGLVFYINTLNNGFVFDDTGLILQNDFIQEGLGGIKKILTTNSFEGYFKHVSGKEVYPWGRYRPLSIMVFSLEYAMFGYSPGAWHLVQVFFYILVIVTVFYFLDNFLCKKIRYGGDIAFIATLLFTIHPIHTEVVANIKSLDEILGLLFAVCTFIFSLMYLDKNELGSKTKGITKTTLNRKTTQFSILILACICYLLTLLSKEYGITLIVILPLLFYSMGYRKPLTATLPYAAMLVVYFLMRFHAIGLGKVEFNNRLLYHPFLLATPVQAAATKIYVLGRYLMMLIFPYPLSCDYSFSQIPYCDFGNIWIWVTLLLYLAIILFAISQFRKKKSGEGYLFGFTAFPIFFFLANIALVSNFVFQVNVIMAERFVFQPSMGFAIVLAWVIMTVSHKLTLNFKRVAIISGMSGLVIICGAEVVQRNEKWQSNTLIFTTDVKTCPNSALLNAAAGYEYVEMAGTMPDGQHKTMLLRDTAMPMLRKSLAMDSLFENSYVMLGVAYYHLGIPDSAKAFWDKLRMTYPLNPFNSNPLHNKKLAQLFLDKGIEAGKNGNFNASIGLIRKGLALEPEGPYLWYNLGRAYFRKEEFDSAKNDWQRALQLKPGFEDAKNAMEELRNMNNDYKYN